MTREKRTLTPLVLYVAAVAFVGSAAAVIGLYALVAALFSGTTAVVATGSVLAVVTIALLAGLGSAARPVVPLVRRTGGLWVWACATYVLGTAGAVAALYAARQNVPEDTTLLFPEVFASYGLAAAAFLPGARSRLATLGAAVLLAASGAGAAWAQSRPPTVDQWLADHHVDRGLLRLADAPPGYRLRGVGARDGGFRATYERTGASVGDTALSLQVRRISYVTERTAANGCPVPLGGLTVRCTDDGDGRLLVRYDNDDHTYERTELRLRRDGIVYVVTPPADTPYAADTADTDGPAAGGRDSTDGTRNATDTSGTSDTSAAPATTDDLSGARAVLSGLRPARKTEPASLTARTG